MKSPVAGSLVSGTVAALSLNLLHEVLRKTVSHPPRVDIVGMRGLAKLARLAGSEPPEHLRSAALAGDLISNSLYYSLVGLGGKEKCMTIGAALGTLAGVGVLVLPPPMRIGDAEVNRTRGTQLMAAGLYVTAGLVAGTVFRKLQQN